MANKCSKFEIRNEPQSIELTLEKAGLPASYIGWELLHQIQ